MAGEQDGAERTESATPRRREEARREGRVPRSQELSGALVLLAGVTVLAAAGGQAMARETFGLLVEGSRWLRGDQLTIEGATHLVALATRSFALALLPVAVAVGVAALASGAVQGRGVLTLRPLAPKWERVSPLAGVRRLVSVQALLTLLKSLAKLVVLGAVGYATYRHAWPELSGLLGAAPADILAVTRSVALRLAFAVGGGFLVVAGADYLVEVVRFERSLRMTRQEVVREQKENEGDPLVKSRMRSLGNQLRRRRMLADVRKADVVITNPTHIAVALRYDLLAGGAPMVLAMGERKLAERIKELAREAGVPCVENRPLARALLATAKVGFPIPVDLYTAVAEVLAFVYRQKGWRPA